MTLPPSLTTTSYLVLGIVGQHGRCTPYAMKQFVASSVGYFWTFPHSQLYAESARLAELGLLIEQVEPAGRKRKTYRLSRAGRTALARWLAEPTAESTEIRDLGLLKLFFAGTTGPQERRALAAEQQRSHEQRRKEYEQLHEAVRDVADAYQLATLEMGLRFERASAEFWAEVLAREEG